MPAPPIIQGVRQLFAAGSVVNIGESQTPPPLASKLPFTIIDAFITQVAEQEVTALTSLTKTRY